MKFYPAGNAGHGHFGLEISDLTPRKQPADLTDELWRWIEQCATQRPDFDATEIQEHFTDSGVPVGLHMVLYVLANR